MTCPTGRGGERGQPRGPGLTPPRILPHWVIFFRLLRTRTPVAPGAPSRCVGPEALQEASSDC